MSDHLTNMAARSLGVAAAIRPRLPSRYEPYRQDTGLLGARQVSGEIDFESPRESDSKYNDVSGATTPLDRLDRPSESPQPPRQNSPAFIAETRREPLVSPRFPRTTPRADSSPILPSTSTESTQQPADVSTSGIVPPTTPTHETHRPQFDATLAPSEIRPPHGLPRLKDSSPSRHLSPHPAPAANQSSEPSIRVTIGRVEVRAVFPPAPVNRTPPQRVRPTLSLDDFLKRNSGAGR